MNKKDRLRPAYLHVECNRTYEESGVMGIVAATNKEGDFKGQIQVEGLVITGYFSNDELEKYGVIAEPYDKFSADDIDVYDCTLITSVKDPKPRGYYQVFLRHEGSICLEITQEDLELYYYDSELDRREIGYMDPRESHGYNEYTTYVDFHTALQDGELDDILAEYISDNLEKFI